MWVSNSISIIGGLYEKNVFGKQLHIYYGVILSKLLPIYYEVILNKHRHITWSNNSGDYVILQNAVMYKLISCGM